MSFYGITDYVAFIVGTTIAVILPGPNSMYCLLISSSQGIKAGYKVAFGIIAGDIVLMSFVVFGAATILTTNPSLFMIFKLIGSLYLSYIGVVLLLDAIKSLKGYKIQSKIFTKSDQPDVGNVFLKAFILSVSNPKAILFFFSFFLLFIDPSYSQPLISFSILGVTLEVISLLYSSVIIFLGSYLVQFFGNKTYFSEIGKIALGLMFVSFAVSLWLSHI